MKRNEVSGVMKKKIYLLLLVVLALMAFQSLMFAQNAKELTKEELLKEIAAEKQQIRETAKNFLIDTLPGLMQSDPDAADQALARYSGMFNTMDQNDFIYLLGHFYARMGENTKAISSFSSLLKTNLNDDARKMLNLVLYQQMIHYLKAGDRKAAKDFLRAIVFENYNIDRYYPTFLYIWADMTADDGEYESALTVLDSYNQNRDTIMNRILPNKQEIISRINNLDLNAFYLNPTEAEFKELSSTIETAKVDLTNVYNELISLKGIIYLDAIVRLHTEEMDMLDGLLTNVNDYYKAKETADAYVADGYAKLQAVKLFSVSYQKQIEIMDRIMQKQYEKFLANDPSIQGHDYSDPEMIRLYDIEKNLELYNNIISELDGYIADPSLANVTEQLKASRADYSEKRTELLIRKDDLLKTRKHTDDIQEQMFNAILNDYYELNKDKKDFDLQVAELEDFFSTDAKTIFDTQMREEIQTRISEQMALAANGDARNEPIRQNVRDMLANLEFIKLQLEYRNLHVKEQSRLAQQSQLTEQQMAEKRSEILAEKQNLISKYQTFLSSNPDFKTIEQPDSTFLISKADLYYNMAELQYAVDLENPSIALESYRKVVQVDPGYYNLDAALYNIGFISSQLKRQQIDSNKSRFYELNQNALSLDDASRYKESDFSEAITAYQRVIDNYPNSALYDESLYRLGILNYYLATDADQPQRYYSIATNCFNQIIDKPDSKFKYDAIYQRGWLRLNSAEEQDLQLAMSDFLTLLNAIENKQITDPALVQDYQDDAVSNIAYCLIALDGTDFNSQAKGVAALQQVFAGYSNQQVISRVVEKAASNKFNLAASMQAVDYLWLKINMNPLALENPSLVDSILMTYARARRSLREGQDFDQITQDLYLNIMNNYGKDSAWFTANKDKPEIAAQLAVIRNAYEKRGLRLQKEFYDDQANEAKLNAFKDHLAKFAAFTELHGDNYADWQKENDKTLLVFSTSFAEKTNLPKNYLKAINNIRQFNTQYPQDEDYFLNEGLAYQYSSNIYNLLKDSYSSPEFRPDPELPANADALYEMYKTNSDRFVGVLRSESYTNPEREQQAVLIILTLADIQYGREKFSEAKALYLQALEKESLIEGPSKFDIYGKLALMAEHDKNYKDAEQYYRQALAFATTPTEKTAITNNINFQIQNSFETAESTGNYSIAADERLRLAAQLPPSDAARIQGYKMGAQEAYVKAKEYQKAIDILLELAGTRTDIEEVYYYYYRAAEIAEADTAMNNKELAKTIRQSFIAKYPSSNQAFSLRLADIQNLEKQPATRTAAAEAYMQLHEEARNKTINTGDVTPDVLMINASLNYREGGNKEKELETYNKFITLYPNHANVIPYLQVIADDYLAKGDTLSFEKTAKTIYTKDKTKNDRYFWIASIKLNKLMYNFDNAYKNKNYAEAFKQRDEYKKLEAAYVKEGLSFETPTFSSAKNNEYFASIQKEYDDIQKRIAFLKSYDSQLTAIEKGVLLTSSPSKLIVVNVNTSWQKNLIAGTTRRIPTFKSQVMAEVKKVSKIIETADATGFDLENARRLRAQNLIARIYAKGVDVIDTQVAYYVRNSSEASGVRQQYQGDVLTAFINQLASGQRDDLLNLEYTTHLNIYNIYQMAGYTDAYTQKSFARLQEWQLVPDYKVDEYPINTGWTQRIDDAPANLQAQSLSTPKGITLGSLTIPSQKQLTLNRSVNARIKPDFALLQLVYPYDIKIRMNGSEVEVGAVATDTLDVNKPVTTTRYAYLLPANVWAEGQNIVELTIPNNSPETQDVKASLQLFTAKQRLAESIPPETVMLYTDPTWRIVNINSETGVETTSAATIASNFGITKEQIDGMENTPARAIWPVEEAPLTSAIFEVDFYLDTEFREGSIDFVAPENASIYLNGQELSSNLAFDYDPEPFQVYATQISSIDKTKVVAGKNTLRFVVNNSSAYRGFLAAVKIVKAGKEEIR